MAPVRRSQKCVRCTMTASSASAGIRSTARRSSTITGRSEPSLACGAPRPVLSARPDATRLPPWLLSTARALPPSLRSTTACTSSPTRLTGTTAGSARVSRSRLRRSPRSSPLRTCVPPRTWMATPSSSTTGWAIGTRSATRAASCPTSASSSLSAWAFLPTQLPHRRRPRSASRSRRLPSATSLRRLVALLLTASLEAQCSTSRSPASTSVPRSASAPPMRLSASTAWSSASRCQFPHMELA
mmetsp:Transcript_12004/g.34549  ORF Transcript_12004/g.34549 Transcript_12004/m.34549 type:complete len:243 (-) Transcript_12004:298-1026(-)